MGGLIDRSIEAGKPPEHRAAWEEELECPPFPLALDYLWRVFHRLARRRGSNGFGLNPISWVDIDAFLRRSRIDLAPWEIEIIEQLDDLHRAAQAQVQSTHDPQSGN